MQNKLQEYIQNWSKSTLTTVDCLKATNIIKLKKKFGDDALKIAITDLMIEKMELFNAKFRMTDVQIRFFNERFLEEYKFDTVADLSVCLNNAAAGKFGTIYNSIDPAIIFGWLQKHMEEKSTERETQKKAERFGSGEVHEDILKQMKKAIEKPKISTDNRNSRRDQHIKAIDALIPSMNESDLKKVKAEMLHFGYDKTYPETFKKVIEKLTVLNQFI